MPAKISGETPDTHTPPRALEDLAGELHALRGAVEDQNKLLNMLLKVEADRLKRLGTGSPLPVATADTSEKAFLETADGIESSAENQNDGEDARQPSTGRRISMWVLLIMLPIPPLLVTVISALMMDALLFTASLIAAAVTLLFDWYYYSSWNDYYYFKTGRRTGELTEVEAQENEQTGHRDRG
jgi:hypothetical protein